jgi:hypothetical protein
MRWLAVLILWLPGWAFAQSTAHVTFEDGQIHGHPVPMQVKPVVLTEGANHFLRITGSVDDCSHMPDHMCPPRNRSTIAFTSQFSQMPVITSSNMRQTYGVDLRYHASSPGWDGVNVELFQGQPGGEGGYGNVNGTGPVIIMGRDGSTLWGRANYNNEQSFTNMAPTSLRAGSWIRVRIEAVWSHDPKIGQLSIYVNDARRLHVTGRDVNLGPATNKLPEFKLGLYGDHATGVLDVDNVYAAPTGGTSPPSSPPPSAPPTPKPSPPVVLKAPWALKAVAP